MLKFKIYRQPSLVKVHPKTPFHNIQYLNTPKQRNFQRKNYDFESSVKYRKKLLNFSSFLVPSEAESEDFHDLNKSFQDKFTRSVHIDRVNEDLKKHYLKSKPLSKHKRVNRKSEQNYTERHNRSVSTAVKVDRIYSSIWFYQFRQNSNDL